jgi:hypothetical protein
LITLLLQVVAQVEEQEIVGQEPLLVAALVDIYLLTDSPLR